MGAQRLPEPCEDRGRAAFAALAVASNRRIGAAVEGPAGATASAAMTRGSRCREAPEGEGASIVECAVVDASQAVGNAHPVAARLHRAHMKAPADCTTCDAYAPGKQFVVAGDKGSLGVLDAEQYERGRAGDGDLGEPTWPPPNDGKPPTEPVCGACHQKQSIPDDNEMVVNKQCVTCRRRLRQAAPQSKAKIKNPEIDPHGSHLGPEIACTVRHQGHQESKRSA